MRFVLAILAWAATLAAQTTDTQIFRAILLPANELPAINSAARAIVDVAVNTIRDPSGQIVSGTIDVFARTTLAAAITVTGLNLHNGAAGAAGPAMFSTGLDASNPRALQTGADNIHIPISVTGDNPSTLASLRALLQDPSKFYVNMPSTDQPNGLMRGQLQRTQIAVLLAIQSSDNPVPAANTFGSGVGQVIAIGTRDAAGNWTSGEVYLSSTYAADDQSAFNGFHIHQGQPGAAGAIGLSATLFPGAIPDYLGLAALGPYYVEIATNNATQLGTFTNLFVNPGSLYIDIHTAQNPTGILRGQLRPTDAMTFPVLLDSARELQPTSVRALAPASFTFYTLRNEDGTLAAATVLSDVDYRLPSASQFIGLWIHDGGDAVDGPVAIKAAPDFAAETGFGNFFGWSLPVANLNALADLLQNPANHYASLHTLSDPLGVARAQFGAVVGAHASIAAVIGANLDAASTTIAPGGLISIFGANLVRTATGLSGWAGRQLPVSLNGSTVRIAGKAAPLIYVSPGQINAQVPVDVAPGVQTVTVDSGNGPGAAFSVTAAPVAPAIFFYPFAAVLKNANFSLISTANPAHAGDVLLVYATGLGQTTPSLSTGALLAGDAIARTATVAATIGGRPAAVAYSIASPGFTGLYQIAVTVPAGVSGNVPLQLQMGTVNSNSVILTVQ